MTARGVSRLVGYLAATTIVGFAILTRDALHAIGDAVRLPGELRRRPNVDVLLAGYQAHAVPLEDCTARDNLAWET